MNVVDSSGWIEYFQDTARADFFALTIEDTDHLLVPTASLYEVHKILRRRLPQSMVSTALNVMRRGKVVDLTDPRAIAAADLAAQHHLAFADAVIYSVALEHGATFWTQDVDYQGLPHVKFFPK